MTRPAGSVRWAAAAALAILFGALVLMALVMDDGEKAAISASNAAIGGRRMMLRADGEQRTLEDFRADDPFQDSKRRVPNGPDPIHNRYFDLQITAQQHSKLYLVFRLFLFLSCHEHLPHQRKAVAIFVAMHRFLEI